MALVSQLHCVMSEKYPAVYIVLVMRLYTKSWWPFVMFTSLTEHQFLGGSWRFSSVPAGRTPACQVTHSRRIQTAWSFLSPLVLICSWEQQQTHLTQVVYVYRWPKTHTSKRQDVSRQELLSVQPFQGEIDLLEFCDHLYSTLAYGKHFYSAGKSNWIHCSLSDSNLPTWYWSDLLVHTSLQLKPHEILCHRMRPCSWAQKINK